MAMSIKQGGAKPTILSKRCIENYYKKKFMVTWKV